MQFQLSLFFVLFTSMASSLTASAQTTGLQPSARSHVLRQGDLVLRQLVTPDFERMPLDRKLFAYYLSLAIEAGRDIAWTQASREGIAIRTLLENLLQFAGEYDAQDLAALEQYAFLVFANHGNYDHTKNEKFVPKDLTDVMLARLTTRAEAAAQKSGLKYDFVAEASRLQRHIFDQDFERYFHAKSGGDLIADSAANFYGRGITLAELTAAVGEPQESHFLTYPERGADGKIKLTRHRAGGRFSNELSLVSAYLQKAHQYGTPAEKAIIDAHIQAIRSGDTGDVKKAEALWVQHRSPDIDFVLGFVEVYEDPQGSRGSWEGFILLRNLDPEVVSRVDNIRQNFDLFEQDNPYDNAYRKAPGSVAPQSEAASLVYSGGANGERPFAGVNLPNWPDLQEKYGSKSFTADNVMKEIGGSVDPDRDAKINAFYLPRYRAALRDADAEKMTHLRSDIQVNFHEILGHGSGKNLPGVVDSALKNYYNALEECRAELASLFHISGDVVKRIGLTTFHATDEGAREFAEMTIMEFFSNHLRSFSRLSDDTTEIRQAHQRGRQVLMNWLVHDGAIRIVESADGVPQVDVVDVAAVRASLGRLWAQIQQAKSTGDYNLAKAIFDQWDSYTKQHQDWRKAFLATIEKLNMPKERPVFMNPKFLVERDDAGEITNVSLGYEPTNGFTLTQFANRQREMTENVRRVIGQGGCEDFLR